MQRTWRILAMMMLLGMLVVLPSCASGAETSEGNKIILDRLEFHPPTLQVESGATVTLLNQDFWGENTNVNIPHRIVIGTDDLGVQPTWTSRTWTAPSEGVYKMKCLMHPSMSGEIRVGTGNDTFWTRLWRFL